MTTLAVLVAGWGVAALLMAVLWLVQRSSGKAAIVDVGWAFATAALGLAFTAAGDGDGVRRALVAVGIAIWGVRLGGHLWQRVAREAEDGRYRAMRESWGTATERNLFLFFQVQAFWAVMFAAPVLAAARNPLPPGPWDVVGIVCWIAAFAGEAVADAQLARFKRDPANAGRVCRAGLWRYSRHPNYFFEWIHWWAYAAFAAGSPLWWVGIAGAVVMWLFLTRVTGIPPTEAQALRSRGAAYADYQRTTSAFVPWWPKEP